jgi:hypothetical protein
VEVTLLPGVKADRKIDELYRTSAPWPRLAEAMPALGLALFVFWKTRSFALVWPCYGYIGYLLLDLLLVPQRRLTKWIRNGSAAAFTIAYVLNVLPSLGRPAPLATAALAALMAGAGFPYLYDRGRTALGFVQGLTLATLAALGAQFYAPSPLGLHVALPLFCAAYAWDTRSVFWRYSAPILAGLRRAGSDLARRRARAAAARDRRAHRLGRQPPAAGRRERGRRVGRGRAGRRVVDARPARLIRRHARQPMRSVTHERTVSDVASDGQCPSRRRLAW